MDIKSVDLNLLLVFDALMRERSVSRGGEALGLSQPAASYALAKLRRMFDDPLFIRTPRGISPTPRAEMLSMPVRDVLEQINTQIMPAISFSPQFGVRTFTLCMSDISEMFFLPPLVRKLRETAPGCAIVALSRPLSQAQEALESGEADIALGYFPDFPTGFFQQRLFGEELVCVVRSKHPLKGARISLDQFAAASHLTIRTSGRQGQVYEKVEALISRKCRVAVSISHRLAIASIVQESDLVSVVPLSFAKVIVQSGKLRVMKLPREFGRFDIMQHWHRRAHRDPANAWLRGVISVLFSEKHHQSRRS